MKRTLPSSRSLSTSCSAPSASNCSRVRLRWNCTRSRWSVCISAQAVLDAGADVGGRVHVLGAHRGAGYAAALRGEDVLVAAVRDELADELLAAPVVDRRVDEVDAGVEHGVEQHAGVVVADRRPVGRAPQLHGAEAESGDLEAGAAQGAQ